jgi:folate-binding protein YgfZ
MHNPWQAFLDQLGAQRSAPLSETEQGVVERFHGDEPTRIIVGDQLAIIRVRGEESEKFLQGQLTCDMKAVMAGHTRLAMHLSLKGRGMTSLRVMPAHGGVDLITPREQVHDCLAALQKYALFSKTTLSLDDNRVALLFTSTQSHRLQAEEQLNAYHIPVPAQPGDALFAEHTGVCRLENSQRYLLLLDHAHAQKMLEQVPVSDIGAAQHWRLSDILAGEGHVQAASRDLWLPQVLNYDVLDGVNFKKGCYLGQEIVARMHFKGKLKQRMQHWSWPTNRNAGLAPGTALRDQNDKAVGEVVSCALDGTSCHVLVVLRLDHSGDLYHEGKPLQASRHELPYAVADLNAAAR